MNNNPNPVYYPQPEPPKESNGMATAALVMGILSLACCGGIFSILAIVFAVVSKNKSADGQMSGMAKAGLIMGIISLVLGLISSVISVATGMLPLLLSGGDIESILDSMF
ncbi:MAG: DUF4190 domain-containing protein [Clostridia bacterium]|nr:DUF4190 domain-containing protein [Clostridia bacterium]